MGKIITSLKIAGLYILLTSATFSYWKNSSSESFNFPKQYEATTSTWENATFGIFSLTYDDCTNDTTKPTITAPANVSVNTDANKCTASGVALGTPTTADNCGVKSVTNDAPSVFHAWNNNSYMDSN